MSRENVAEETNRDGIYRRARHLLPGALLFATLAGFINTVALDRFATPVSHMSGALSHFGVNWGEGRVADAWDSMRIVGGFVAGAIVAGAMIGRRSQGPARRFAAVLSLEAVLIGLGAWLLADQGRAGLPWLAMACGLQNAMTSSYCGLLVRTTHVTGTVTDLGLMLGQALRHRRLEVSKLVFVGGVTLGFAAGGVSGVVAVLRWGTDCLWAGVAVTLGGAWLLATAGGRRWLHRDLATEGGGLDRK